MTMTPADTATTIMFAIYLVRPEQPASLPDSLCLNPGTTLQKLQDLRSWRFVFLQILRGSHGSKAITTTDW